MSAADYSRMTKRELIEELEQAHRLIDLQDASLDRREQEIHRYERMIQKLVPGARDDFSDIYDYLEEQ